MLTYARAILALELVVSALGTVDFVAAVDAVHLAITHPILGNAVLITRGCGFARKVFFVAGRGAAARSSVVQQRQPGRTQTLRTVVFTRHAQMRAATAVYTSIAVQFLRRASV
jgi:hypothetical protein